MFRTFPRLLLAGLLLPAALAARGQDPPAENPPPGNPVLAPGTLKAGGPEAVLPRGAFLHVRINNPDALLRSLDKMIRTALPEEAVPLEFKPLLEHETPVVAFLGLNAFGQATSPQQVGEVFGLALDRPASLTLYPAPNGVEFVLSLPMGNPAALTGFLFNVVGPSDFRESTVGGHTVYEIVGTNPALPASLSAVCSPDTVYLCSSARMAGALAAVPPDTRMAVDGLFPRILAQFASDDALVAADTEAFQPLIASLADRYRELPPPLVAGLREKLMGALPPDQLKQINLRLRFQLGFRDLDELLDWVECLAVAGYEVLFQELARQIQATEGAALAVDVGEKDQKLSFSFYAKTIDPDRFPRPLPLDEIRTALEQVPGSRDAIAATGRRPAEVPSELFAAWLAAVEEKARAKELSREGWSRFRAYAAARRVVQPLAARVPWTLETAADFDAGAAGKPPAGLTEYLEQSAKRLGRAAWAVPLTAVPGTDGEVLERHFREEAETLTANEAEERRLSDDLSWEKPFYDKVSRYRAEPTDGPVKKLVLETAYITHGGLFGFSQHELINRTFLHYRPLGNHLVYHTQGGDASWLNRAESLPKPAVPPAVHALLLRVPDGAHAFSTLRLLHHVRTLVDELGRVEDLIHADADAYLAVARETLAANPDDFEAFETAMLEKDPPLPVMTLNLDEATGEPYCTLPGFLTYPRPKVVPVLRDLLQDYLARADETGGLVAWSRVVPGRYDAAVIQNTEGLGILIRTTVNRFLRTYVHAPGGAEALEAALGAPDDGDPRTEQRVLTNTLWDFLLD